MSGTPLGALPYADRVALWLDAHPEAQHTGVIATATCVDCGVTLEDRLNADRTDHGWHVGGPVPHVDPWQRLDDLLASGDAAAYSLARATRGLLGAWPWEHNHRPA